MPVSSSDDMTVEGLPKIKLLNMDGSDYNTCCGRHHKNKAFKKQFLTKYLSPLSRNCLNLKYYHEVTQVHINCMYS